MGGEKDSPIKRGVMRGHCCIGCGRERRQATGDTGSSAGCQLGGGCWCNSFFPLSVLSSMPFREPSFFLFIISSKERQCRYWDMPFFLRVSHITSFLLLPAAFISWLLACHQLAPPGGSPRVGASHQSPEAVGKAASAVRVSERKSSANLPSVKGRHAHLGGDGHWVAVRKESPCRGGSQVSPHVFFPRVFRSLGKQTFLTASPGRRN